MKSVLITGSNRGLGLGLVKAFLKSKNIPERIIATYRDPNKSEELKQLAIENKNVSLINIDVNNFKEYKKFYDEVAKVVKDDGLNTLINNAGVSPKYTRIQYLKVEQMMDTFLTNTVAPLMVTKNLLPLLKLSAERNSSLALGCDKAAIINVSSMLGSCTLNKDGGLYPYKCSKCAINMGSVSLSIDLKKEEILVMSLHPGWVKTDMGGSNAPMSIEESTQAIVNLLPKLTDKHNGGFYQWNGEQMPW